MNLAPGTEIERYVVKDVIGSGGMATVYRVQHALLGTQHALKVLHRDRADIAERLIREGQLQAKLDPRVVVPVTDILSIGSAPALLMPFVRGCSLRDVLDSYQPSMDEALYLLHCIARGLAAAHAEQITHRDLKPANVLLELKHGRLLARVADFGIARQESVTLLTADQALIGTIVYASPEQLEAPATVDTRSDLWSLGVMAYELLTGHRPFSSNGPEPIIIRILRGAYDLDPVPGPWKDLIDRLLQIRRDDRVADISTVLQALEAAQPVLPAVDGPLVTAMQRHLSGLTTLPDARSTPYEAFPSTSRRSASSPESSDDVNLDPDSLDPSTVLLATLPPVSSLIPKPRHNLAPERDAFIGRQAELEKVHQFVQNGTQLLTLLGFGGTGKTRLASRYARMRLDEWSGGVWFCDLTEARTAEGTLAAMARALSVPLGKQEPVQQLGHAIAGRGHALFIIDNVEQVVSFIRPLLAAWLQHAPEAVFIATSRTVIELPQEQTWVVPPLHPSSARELFVARATLAKGGFSPGDADWETIDALVKELDHLPLPIELAAARVRVMTPRKILERLGQRFRLLSANTGKPDRHLTLRATLDWSWDLLTGWERVALAQCSVFEGGFDLEAAEAVLDLEGQADAPWGVDAIQSLVDKSLLRTIDDDRFTMLVSVQAYAREQLERLEGAASTINRHANYYASYGTIHGIQAIFHRGGVELMHRLQADLENVVVAWERALALENSEMAVPLAMAASQGMLRSAPAKAIAELLESSSELPNLDLFGRCRLLLAAAESRRHNGDLRQALEHYDLAIQGFQELDDTCSVARAHSGKGNVLWQMGDPEAARGAYEFAHGLAEEHGFKSVLITTLTGLGILNGEAGHYKTIEQQFVRAIHLAREMGNRSGEATVLGNMGILYKNLGHYGLAFRLLRQSYEASKDIGNRSFEANALGSIGSLYRYKNDFEESKAHFEMALAIQREIGNRKQQSILTFELAALFYAHAEHELARTYLNEARSIATQAYKPLLPMTQGLNAKLTAHGGDPDAALSMLDAAEQELRSMNYTTQACLLQATRATVLAIAGRPDHAHQALALASEAYATNGTTHQETQRELRDARLALGLPQTELE